MMQRALRTLAILALAASFARTGAAADIDYGRPEAWLARPGLASPATLTPKDSGYSALEAAARADVFYVHPTTGMREDVANVPIDDAQALAMGRIMLMAQATPFNGIARIYAPRYRQIALHVYEEGEAALQAPMTLAYEDVRQAFAHYAAHDNQGRPFFLVAHSQGSEHGLRLLQEEIQGAPLEARLVAAYLPGEPTPRSIFTDHLTRVPPCTRPEQIGCVAIWGVFGEGHRDFRAWEAANVYWDASARRWRQGARAPLVNINPVSWTDDGVPTLASQHLGAVPFGVPATHFTRPVEHLVTARAGHGYTLVSPALPAGLFDDGGTFGGTNYHVFDINLFWVDLRANARHRLAAFLRQREGAAYPIIEGPMAATAIAGEPFQLRFSVHNAAERWHAESLPQGLHLDAETGEISGVPVTPGSHAVVATASNAAGTHTAELALSVAPARKQ